MNHRLRKSSAGIWLKLLFAVAKWTHGALRCFRPLVVWGVPMVSKKVRINTKLNGSRIAGDSTRGFTRDVVGSFFDFVCEVAAGVDAEPAELRSQIVAIEGKDRYLTERQSKRGAVLVTAHMGSFEIGLAALTEVEAVVHVVFKRDEHDGFEQLRRPLRNRLGVTESAIDDGWPALVSLRDALQRDEVVVMQADRAMPGQKSTPVHIGSGSLLMPLGPLKLAKINGSPIVPVFAIREGPKRYRVLIEPAIDPFAADAIEQIGQAIEKFILRYPRQWLVLDAAFVEDADRAIQ